MSRPGVTSGKGGRNHQLNWHDGPSASVHGDWRLDDYGEGQVYVARGGRPVLRAFGNFTGPLRLKSRDHAKRWVERVVHRESGRRS